MSTVVVDMLIRKFEGLPEDLQQEEIGKLTAVIGVDNISTVKRSDESEEEFMNRCFLELLPKLPPAWLNYYSKTFFGTYGATRDIDRVLRKFSRLRVETQEAEIGKLCVLTGEGEESLIKLQNESERDFKVRSVFELMLKLPSDSLEDYKKQFHKAHGGLLEGRSSVQPMKLTFDEEAPPGFNLTYPPQEN